MPFRFLLLAADQQNITAALPSGADLAPAIECHLFLITVAREGTNIDIPKLSAGAPVLSARASMDILAGIFAYMAGIGALFGALAVSFFVFFSTPHGPLQTQAQPQSANAMLVRPSTPGKSAAAAAHAKQSASQSAARSEKHAAASHAQGKAKPTALARDVRGKHTPTAAQARRFIEEERSRRWAYQQEPSQEPGRERGQESGFESRFLGYAD